MPKIIGVAEENGDELYVVEVRTMTGSREFARHRRARVNALAASGFMGSSVDLIRGLSRGEIQSMTEVVREMKVDDKIASEVWEIQVRVF